MSADIALQNISLGADPLDCEAGFPLRNGTLRKIFIELFYDKSLRSIAIYHKLVETKISIHFSDFL